MIDIFEYIRKHNLSYAEWCSISKNVNFSKELIIEFFDKIDLHYLMENKYISDEVKEFCRMFL